MKFPSQKERKNVPYGNQTIDGSFDVYKTQTFYYEEAKEKKKICSHKHKNRAKLTVAHLLHTPKWIRFKVVVRWYWCAVNIKYHTHTERERAREVVAAAAAHLHLQKDTFKFVFVFLFASE